MSIRAPDGAKNGQILPTGQWYAPSAVTNDALIMPEYARYARVYQNMPEYARLKQSISEYARVLHGIAWYCIVLHCIVLYLMVSHGIA